MSSDHHIKQSGYLDRGYHRIYWEDWGNPDGVPVMALHGGPGGSIESALKAVFDSTKHRVIFHDQRGGGKSTPFADTHENTSAHLISDIEALREHLGIETMYVVGGSWGSTLSLLYAIAHPERVRRLMLWGVYLIRKEETDYVNLGLACWTFPEAWECFISFVPLKERAIGEDVMRFYASQVNSTDIKVAQKYADEWVLWEWTLCSINYDPVALEADIMGNKECLATARLELHYFQNGCFVPENHIMDNVPKITHIPCTVVQGRFDFCTPPFVAIDLKRAYGENLTLHMVNSGHMPDDPGMGEKLREVAARELV